MKPRTKYCIISYTKGLIESNGLGLFTPSDAPPEDEQPPSWQKHKKKERKKTRGFIL